MTHIKELQTYCNELLNVENFQDYCPNGLQVAGREQVNKIVSGVTASLELVEAAIAAEADLLLVHHGYFWKNEAPCIVGIKKRRIARLLAADINLLAYHLPLDAHPVYGNNAQLGLTLGLEAEGTLAAAPLVWQGRCAEAMRGEVMAERIHQALGRAPLHIAGSERPIRRVAWCSGGAQGYIEAAAAAGVDAYISGEISEPTTHLARELGLHYFAAGHHATERYGAYALGEHLAAHFELKHEFIDIDNPV